MAEGNLVNRAANIVFQKSLKTLLRVLNVRVTAGHRPARAQ